MPYPVVPEYITVHLGAPDAPAENVTLSFPNYIKNVPPVSCTPPGTRTPCGPIFWRRSPWR